MVQPTHLAVKLMRAKNCFVQVPSSFASAHQAGRSIGAVVLRLSWDDNASSRETPTTPRHAFVSWNGGLSAGIDSIEVPQALAQTLGLDALLDRNLYLAVRVEAVDYVANALRVDVEPCTSDDWEILELNAEHLEGELLQQVCVVYPGQLIPIWVHGTTLITLQVLSCGGAPAAASSDGAPRRLTAQAEVVVSPKPRAGGDAAAGGAAPPLLRQSAPLRVQPWPGGARWRDGLRSSNGGSGGSWWLEPPDGTCAACHPATLARLDGYADEHARRVAARSLRHSRGIDAHAAAVLALVWRDDGGASAAAAAEELGAAGVEVPPPSSVKAAVVVLAAHPHVAPGHIALPRGSALLTGCGPLSLARVRLLQRGLPEARPRDVALSPLPPPPGAPPLRLRADVTLPHVRAALRAWADGGGGAEDGGACSAAPCERHSGGRSGSDASGSSSSSSSAAGGASPGAGAAAAAVLCDGDVIRLTLPAAAAATDAAAAAAAAAGDSATVAVDFQVAVLDDGDDAARAPSATQPPVPPHVLLAEAANAGEVRLSADAAWSERARSCLALREAFGAGPPREQLAGVDNAMTAALNYLAPTLVAARARRGGSGSGSGSGAAPAAAAAGCLLVHGGSGTGKTALLRAAAHALRTSPAALARTVRLDCRGVVGRKMVQVLRVLGAAFAVAGAHAPALVVLDDLDALCPAEGDEQGPANAQSARIADCLSRLISDRGEGVAVAASANAGGASAIHASLWRCGLFDRAVELLPPRPAQRAAILRKLCGFSSSGRRARGSSGSAATCDGCDGGGGGSNSDRGGGGSGGGGGGGGGGSGSDSEGGAAEVDWDAAAAATEGCRPSDLTRIARRAQHAAALRRLRRGSSGVGSGGGGEQAARVTQTDITAALDGFTPEALAAARLTAPSRRGWGDVGGLAGVRAALRDLLELPVRYRRLVERAPCRLPTGALLYGPPGCGKTLLAGAAAAECGLNFLSVKGPEVLDKYIGASEQAVRGLFARATAAAPCLLFFDEFEALAPRRGSDNTGVTDRVVNQLLTFLDGVEGLAGVYVLAATSRPDMLDPALLRPGRLDRQLYCGFPSAQERLEIIRAIAKPLSLEVGALEALEEGAQAAAAAAFTGADLQGVINTAQLEAVHNHLAQLQRAPPLPPLPAAASPPPPPPGARVAVSAEHVRRAFALARPSMSAADRAAHEAAYRKFAGGRGADFAAASATDDGTLRTALK